MKEIVKGSLIIIIFMATVFVVLVIATELIYDSVVERIRDNYQEELVYPTRFSVPSDAKRLNPFYMPNNLKENTEYVPPVYDIIQVNGLGKLISGAEIFFDEEANYYSITYNDKVFNQLATYIGNL